MKKRKDYNIKCQRKSCRLHFTWLVKSPEWNKSKYDVLQEPIGFCGLDHLMQYFSKEYAHYCTASDGIKQKRFEE